jgi:hypothetical protein
MQVEREFVLTGSPDEPLLRDPFEDREPRHELDEASMPLDWWAEEDLDTRWIEAQQDQDRPELETTHADD